MALFRLPTLVSAKSTPPAGSMSANRAEQVVPVPIVNVATPAPIVNVESVAPVVNVPAQLAPVVNVTPTAAVNVSAAQPSVNVASAVPAINVNATAPTVNVAAGAAPQVTVTPLFAPVNNIAPPTVNVAAPTVTLTPTFTVPQAAVNVAAAAPVITINPIALASSAPMMESRVASVGAVQAAALADHTHQTISSRTYHTLTLDTPSGEYRTTVAYTRTFTAAPLFAFGVQQAAGGTTYVEHVSDIMGTGAQVGLYVGCVIRGKRGQALPSFAGVTLVTGLVSALANFDPFGGNAAGVKVCVVALPAS